MNIYKNILEALKPIGKKKNVFTADFLMARFYLVLILEVMPLYPLRC